MTINRTVELQLDDDNSIRVIRGADEGLISLWVNGSEVFIDRDAIKTLILILLEAKDSLD